jgi:hypothetical protein
VFSKNALYVIALYRLVTYKGKEIVGYFRQLTSCHRRRCERFYLLKVQVFFAAAYHDFIGARQKRNEKKESAAMTAPFYVRSYANCDITSCVKSNTSQGLSNMYLSYDN